jgi:hypothetical protein
VEACHDRHSRGTQGRKQSTDQPHDQRERNALGDEPGAKLEIKHDLREVAAKGRGRDAVEYQVGGGRPQQAADDGEQQRFSERPDERACEEIVSISNEL